MDHSRRIENLIYTYAERIDAGDLEGVAELFRDGQIVSPAQGVSFTGYDEVLALYKGSARIYQPQGTPLTRHVTTNVIIEVDESTMHAQARASYMVLQATPDLPLQVIICGRYRDEFSWTGEQWRFATREMHVDLMGDCSQHLLYELQTDKETT